MSITLPRTTLALALLATGWIAAAPASAAEPPVKQEVGAYLHEADAALRARHPQLAEARLERAETALLNARAAGDAHLGRAIDKVVSARADIRHGDSHAAEAVLRHIGPVA